MLKLLHITIARFASLKMPAPQWMVGFLGVFLGVCYSRVPFFPHIWSPPLPKLVQKTWISLVNRSKNEWKSFEIPPQWNHNFRKLTSAKSKFAKIHLNEINVLEIPLQWNQNLRIPPLWNQRLRNSTSVKSKFANSTSVKSKFANSTSVKSTFAKFHLSGRSGVYARVACAPSAATGCWICLGQRRSMAQSWASVT